MQQLADSAIDHVKAPAPDPVPAVSRGGETAAAPQLLSINQASGHSGEIDQLVNRLFEYHPWDAAKTMHGVAVRVALADAVKVIIEHVPPSADRSAAIRKIREARMDCNSALTFDGRY
jgi:hypothetical protein